MVTVLTQVFKADRDMQAVMMHELKNIIVFVCSTQ